VSALGWLLALGVLALVGVLVLLVLVRVFGRDEGAD
jgi:hypothetical protein